MPGRKEKFSCPITGFEPDGALLTKLARRPDCRYHPIMNQNRQALQDLFDQAVALHQRGDLGPAERLYQQALLMEPRSFAPRHMMGVIRFQQGRHDEAVALIQGALDLNPNVGAAWVNLGHVQNAAGRTDEAATAYARAVALQPADAAVLGALITVLWGCGRRDEALAGMDQLVALRPDEIEVRHHRANMRREARRLADALADYDMVLKARPDLAETWSNRGAVLSEMGRPAEALESLGRALALEPDMPAALNNRAFTLRELSRFDEALVNLERVLAQAPDYAPAHANRGRILSELMRLEEGFQSFRKAGELAYGAPTAASNDPSHKRRHDEEQRVWLIEHGSFAGDRVVGRAVNPINAESATRTWRDSDPRIVVIDNLLTDEALASLRHYCQGAKVWHTSYPQGYLGAFPESGFAAPLLAQVAEELAETFRDIFADHALRYHWAFKYDSSLEGIGIHADEAAVNVNFWITPDTANLDPESGGLVIWDKAAPLDWHFAKYNADESAAYDFLARSGAQTVTVPYRANRAVIFDSNLFHKTDTIRFATGYENRRINITMLYGRRGRG
jgi:tetratricopeptide (TPR) repeat protein